MPQYILLVHGNVQNNPTPEEWGLFFSAARESGLFKGGSEIGSKTILGSIESAQPSDHIVAYMRFDSDNKQELLDLLETHPVVLHGGSVELCEMPESEEPATE